MKIIDVDTIGQAWVNSCNLILREGTDTKDGDEKLRQITHLIVKIKNPREKDGIIEKNGCCQIFWNKKLFQSLTIVKVMVYVYSIITEKIKCNG